MIIRDESGCIGQHGPDNYLDFGDSCMKTSIYSLSTINMFEHLNAFVDDDYKVIRHNKPPWNDSKLTSRDQVVPLLAARCLERRLSTITREVVRNYPHMVNKDILDPGVKWFMRVCAGDTSYSFLGDKFIRLAIWYASHVDKDHELNQLFCMTLVLGKKYTRLLCDSHKGWEANLRGYWSGWRDNAEIGEAFIERIKREII